MRCCRLGARNEGVDRFSGSLCANGDRQDQAYLISVRRWTPSSSFARPAVFRKDLLVDASDGYWQPADCAHCRCNRFQLHDAHAGYAVSVSSALEAPPQLAAWQRAEYRNDLFSKYGFDDGDAPYADIIQRAFEVHLTAAGFEVRRLETSLHNRRVIEVELNGHWFSTEMLRFDPPKLWDNEAEEDGPDAPEALIAAIDEFLPVAHAMLIAVGAPRHTRGVPLAEEERRAWLTFLQQRVSQVPQA